MDASMNSMNPNANKNNNSFVIGTRENVSVLERRESVKGGLTVEVLQYDKLQGCTNVYSAQKLWFMSQENIKARQIAIYINNDGVRIEPGAMSYFQGPLEMTSGVNGIGGVINRAISSKLTGERFALPEYRGSGILVLEPSFKHFIIAELEQGETIITDKGMFYCAQSSVTVNPIMNSQISGALLGGEGVFQQALTGPGLVILESPVPMCEINILHLNNDILRVDGNFTLLRSGNLQFTVERSARTLIGSAVSGEGLVNVFRGTGDVWVAPTIKVYQAISMASAFGGDISSVDMNTSNGNSRVR